ncbi:hypothetical protein [Ensifer soli]|uniref:hypothetical protein n=1 Tax=Ciceribacter sp. sgz301302 TaxID=3342379 RepID=UPI0035BA0FE1
MFASAALMQEMSALWFTAPMVIATRTQEMMMAAMAGRSSDSKEMHRMVTEKLAAAGESIVAFNMAVAAESMTFCLAVATGRMAGLDATANRLAVAALKPYGKRVRANARRLSK